MIFSIPVTSAETERTFSLLGHIHSDRRNRLSVKNLNALAIVNQFYNNSNDNIVKNGNTNIIDFTLPSSSSSSSSNNNDNSSGNGKYYL